MTMRPPAIQIPAPHVSAPHVSALPQIILEPLARVALLEDLGLAGDITSLAVIPADQKARMALKARQAGIVAGLDLAILTFRLADPNIEFQPLLGDGAQASPGETIAYLEGPARGLMMGERCALNFLCHLSGIASATAAYVARTAGYKAQIVCTRKTTPGLRAIEKYAVRAGGGCNHRFGLDDAALIKDNHIAIAGGLRRAVEAARAYVGHMVKIQVEVDDLGQLEEALSIGVDAVLLDNMEPEDLRRAVRMTNGAALTEASGRVRLETVTSIAEAGVDLISVGSITHSAPILDIGLDFAP